MTRIRETSRSFRMMLPWSIAACLPFGFGIVVEVFSMVRISPATMPRDIERLFDAFGRLADQGPIVFFAILLETVLFIVKWPIILVAAAGIAWLASFFHLDRSAIVKRATNMDGQLWFIKGTLLGAFAVVILFAAGIVIGSLLPTGGEHSL